MDEKVWRKLIGHEVIIIWKEQEEIKMRQFDPDPKRSAICSRTAIILCQQLAVSKDIEVISRKVRPDKCVSRSLQFISCPGWCSRSKIMQGKQDIQGSSQQVH